MDETCTETPKVWGLTYWGWAAVFIVAMIGASFASRSGLVPAGAAIWVQLAPLVLVAPMAHAQLGLFRKHGVSSPALTRHNRAMLLTLGAFVVCMCLAVYLSRAYRPTGLAAFALALLAIAPVGGIVWSAARYLREETDEFLRHRAVNALLVSLAFVLIVGSLWGSLQMFGLAAPSLNLWVLPAWGFGFGLGNLWWWTRDR
ncbi:MAG TPA: hypothetical protein VI168_08335 [Croceibacterium sp.]